MLRELLFIVQFIVAAVSGGGDIQCGGVYGSPDGTQTYMWGSWVDDQCWQQEPTHSIGISPPQHEAEYLRLSFDNRFGIYAEEIENISFTVQSPTGVHTVTFDIQTLPSGSWLVTPPTTTDDEANLIFCDNQTSYTIPQRLVSMAEPTVVPVCDTTEITLTTLLSTEGFSLPYCFKYEQLYGTHSIYWGSEMDNSCSHNRGKADYISIAFNGFDGMHSQEIWVEAVNRGDVYHSLDGSNPSNLSFVQFDVMDFPVGFTVQVSGTQWVLNAAPLEMPSFTDNGTEYEIVFSYCEGHDGVVVEGLESENICFMYDVREVKHTTAVGLQSSLAGTPVRGFPVIVAFIILMFMSMAGISYSNKRKNIYT